MNPLDRGFQEAREGGVTTVLTGPGSANPIAGQFLAMKTNGRWVDEMVVKAPVAMKFALGENPKSVYNERKETPVTRDGHGGHHPGEPVQGPGVPGQTVQGR